jgi:hypothetical protein
VVQELTEKQTMILKCLGALVCKAYECLGETGKEAVTKVKRQNMFLALP